MHFEIIVIKYKKTLYPISISSCLTCRKQDEMEIHYLPWTICNYTNYMYRTSRARGPNVGCFSDFIYVYIGSSLLLISNNWFVCRKHGSAYKIDC
jgi:hypothetical protein